MRSFGRNATHRMSSPREQPIRRPLTVLDVLILVVGLAVGLALLREIVSSWMQVDALELFPLDDFLSRELAWLPWRHVFLPLATGLALVGPLVFWRGVRLTGQWCMSTGAWLWLLAWPTAVASLVVIISGVTVAGESFFGFGGDPIGPLRTSLYVFAPSAFGAGLLFVIVAAIVLIRRRRDPNTQPWDHRFLRRALWMWFIAFTMG